MLILIYFLLISKVFFQNLQKENFILELNEKSYLNIFFGEPKIKLKFLIDISSNINILFNNKIEQSKTFSKSHVLLSISNLFGNFEGNLCEDYFYLNDEKFLLNFIYVSNEEKRKFLNCDGILSLGKISEFNSNFLDMNLILKLKEKNLIDKKIITFEKNKISFGSKNDFSENRKIISNRTIIKLIDSNEEFPCFFSLIKGFSFYNNEIYNERINREINLKFSFVNFNIFNFNDFYVPKNKIDFFVDFFLKILFQKKFGNDFKNNSNENNVKLPNLKGINNENTGNNVISFEKNNFLINNFQTSIILTQNQILRFDFENKFMYDSNYYYFNFEIIENINDYFFINLNYLNFEGISFNFEENEIVIYNCEFCGRFTYDEKFGWLFSLIFVLSLIAILFILISIKFFESNKQKQKMKLYKNYNLII